MVAHIKNVGQCFVGIDVSRAVGYNDDENARRVVQTHIPGRYRRGRRSILTSDLGKI